MYSDLRGVTYGGQIDRPIPREQQANVAVDGLPCVVGEIEAKRLETLIEGERVRLGKAGKVLDTRRERFSLTAQALLLEMCPPPSVRVAPGVVKSRTAGWVGLP